MQNKYVINIVIANLLWSFIPVLVNDLVSEISVFMIIFIRFIVSGSFLLFIAIIFTLINNHLTNNAKISLKLLFENIKHKNRRFNNIRNYVYYILIGFCGVILNIIFFFLTLKTTSISFTMIGFLLSVIIIAVYEAGRNFEKFDIFKVLYITLMFFAILIILFVSYESAQINGYLISLNGFVYLLLFSVAISFLYVGIDKDSYSKLELESINENKYYKIPRLLIKMALSFLVGTLLMIPFLLCLNFLPIFSDFKFEIISFFNEFSNIFLYLGRWEILYLIIFSTIIPYLLIYIANVNWKSLNLTYSQWNSILNLIDPMGSIILAVIIVSEFFPLELLVIFIFLIIISIILRYAHEVKNMVNAYLLITLKKGVIGALPVKILKNYGIVTVNSLIGSHDLLIKIKISSIKDFYYLVDKKLKSVSDIKKIEIYFINRFEKII